MHVVCDKMKDKSKNIEKFIGANMCYMRTVQSWNGLTHARGFMAWDLTVGSHVKNHGEWIEKIKMLTLETSDLETPSSTILW